jgi:hypothetical protein
MLLSLCDHYQHRAVRELIVQSDANRNTAFDALCPSIGALISAERPLGDLSDRAEAEALRRDDLASEGGASPKAVVIPVILRWPIAHPLG